MLRSTRMQLLVFLNVVAKLSERDEQHTDHARNVVGEGKYDLVLFRLDVGVFNEFRPLGKFGSNRFS